jgi:hypothetical protein
VLVGVEFDEFAGLGRAHCAPGVPGDCEDDECDGEADDRVGSGVAERDQGGAGHDSEGDEAVDAGVVAVGGCERPEVGELLGVDDALDCFVERDAGADEDRGNDEEAGDLSARKPRM